MVTKNVMPLTTIRITQGKKTYLLQQTKLKWCFLYIYIYLTCLFVDGECICYVLLNDCKVTVHVPQWCHGYRVMLTITFTFPSHCHTDNTLPLVNNTNIAGVHLTAPSHAAVSLHSSTINCANQQDSFKFIVNNLVFIYCY